MKTFYQLILQKKSEINILEAYINYAYKSFYQSYF
jgi:hypothetical protein